MQITNQPITYTQKTSPNPTLIRVTLNAADFNTTPPSYINIQPGPGWLSAALFDTAPQDITPSFAGWTVPVDLTQAMTQSNLADIQSVWIDNTVNPGYIQLLNRSTGQVIFCDAFSQGSYPIFSNPGTKSSQWAVTVCDRSHPFGGVAFYEQSSAYVSTFIPGQNQVEAAITLMFTDATMPLAQWNYKSRGCRAYDSSTTITVGGTFQVVGALHATLITDLYVSAYRRGFLIQNPIAATEPLYVALSSGITNEPVPTLDNSIQLAAGALYQERGDDAYTGAVNVMAATTGHKFTAKIFI